MKNFKDGLILFLSVLVAVEFIILFKTRPKTQQPKARKKPPVAAVKSPAKLPPVVFKGKIAIVLDDWGYNLNNLPIVNQISEPFTAAVLPYLPYSKAVSEELHNRNVEIILHLPMEPHEKYRLEKNTLLTTLTDLQIRKIAADDLDELIYAKGISNHQGSRATEDIRVMAAVFGLLKKRNMYFLDSYVTAQSVCSELALKKGLRFAKRDVFLDNKADPEYIRRQLMKLKSKARMSGFAVGIGHDRKTTLLVLKDELPRLEKEGYKLVYLSEVVK